MGERAAESMPGFGHGRPRPSIPDLGCAELARTSIGARTCRRSRLRELSRSSQRPPALADFGERRISKQRSPTERTRPRTQQARLDQARTRRHIGPACQSPRRDATCETSVSITKAGSRYVRSGRVWWAMVDSNQTPPACSVFISSRDSTRMRIDNSTWANLEEGLR